MPKQIAGIFILTFFLLAFASNVLGSSVWGEVSVCSSSPFLDCDDDDDDDDYYYLLNEKKPSLAVPTFSFALISISTSPVQEFVKSIFHPPKSIL
jgi:hypothetical protein